MTTALLLAAALSADPEDWSAFRGPDATGEALDAAVPLEWADGRNVAWKTDLPGPGASSPVVFEGRIYLTCATGAEDDNTSNLTYHVLCHDLETGGEVWRLDVKKSARRLPSAGFVALHGHASATPAVDASGVYCSFGPEGVVAVSLDGQRMWRADVGDDTHAFGTAPSPALAGDVLVVNASVESGRLIGLDKTTGKELWTRDGIKRAWSTPVVVTSESGREECVVSMEGYVAAFDPATGKPLWQCEGIQDYVCPSVVAGDGVVYAIGGRKSFSLAVRTGGEGDVTESHRLWTLGEGSNVPSPALANGHLFWAHHDKGILYCVNAETGKLVYKERTPDSPGRIYASAVAAGGRVYHVSREGGTLVVPAEPRFEILARNRFGDDTSVFNATPAVAGDRLILRSDQALYAIGE